MLNTSDSRNSCIEFIRVCRDFDDIVKQQKDKIETINTRILILNIVMTATIALGCSMLLFLGLFWYSIAVTLLLIISIYVLLYSVYKIRKLIKAIEHAFPNEKLMMHHFFNFFIYAVLRVSKHTLEIIW